MCLPEGIDAQLQSVVGLRHGLHITFFVDERIELVSLKIAVVLKFGDAIEELKGS